MQLERRDESPTGDSTEFTLRWHHHDVKLADTMTRAWEKKLFLDVTLASGHRTIGAHRLVLCACSALLENLLTSPAHSPVQSHTNPMLYFNDIDFEDLEVLVEFMYRGSMTVTYQTLPGIINAARILQIRGLNRDIDEPVDSPPESSGCSEPPVTEPIGEPTRKRMKKEEDIPRHVEKEEPADSDHEEIQTHGTMMDHPNFEEQKQQQLAAFLSVLAQQTPLNPSTKQPSSSGPSPALRSRLVWDPAHIVYLESWYGRETRYPNLAQCQAYANQLSTVPQTDQSGKSRTSMSVTAQNVSHWFQNRRRKDTHPEIEEKRVKRSQTRRSKSMKTNAGGNPLDLTQPSVPSQRNKPTTPHSRSPQEQSHHEHEDRDSDEEPGLCIAEQAHTNSYNSDTENDHPAPIHHPQYQV
ncbi:protein bric-a-brac 1-like [Daphnia carinata]|uniref:protein bric-a-brac 1-like n=1 Tax=Daphnia carinata TaxID=120202 RepID=UPI002868731E|nr:protein bric-a-brac 1-like [Daphnia carinata]